MFLEVATTLGAVAGAFLVTLRLIPPQMIEIVFGVVLIFSATFAVRLRNREAPEPPPDPLAARLRLDGSFPTTDGIRHYHVHRVPAGFGLMFVAGLLSGLLGIGSGAFKVLAMDQVMRIPFKVSTTTSNFMIGVTAAASAGIYLRGGYIDPGLSMPVMLGVLAGSLLGARVLMAAKTKVLRLVFGGVIFALAVQMIYKGISGE
jgi:uncharacterized membrane protein YfcA